jgi:hypothetical protein
MATYLLDGSAIKDALYNLRARIGVVGLGYVGLLFNALLCSQPLRTRGALRKSPSPMCPAIKDASDNRADWPRCEQTS